MVAIVIVRGEVVARREFPAKDDRPAQVSLTVNDGERFSMFVEDDPKEALSLLEVGDMVDVRGRLRLNQRYLNIDEPELMRTGRVVWDDES